MEATKRMVEAGLGVALLPKIALQRELEAGTLQLVDIDDVPNSSRQIALIGRRDRRLGPAARAFVDMVFWGSWGGLINLPAKQRGEVRLTVEVQFQL
jgi:DNA-binding transcriptional LysR family regulator